MRISTLLFALTARLAVSSRDDDLITSLPGSDGLNLPKMYAGYLDLPNSAKHVYYWLVQSENDPENDPVAMWTNGGPGCSGLIGLMTEQGPFRPQEDGSLAVNPTGWQKYANMFFIEQPVGVGFSYSDEDEDYITGDYDAAVDMYAAIGQFFLRFPELADNDFYLTSESYGGHYLPVLTKYILDQEETNRDADTRNFKGFFLGNPWTDPHANHVGRVQVLYGHGLIPKPDYDVWTRVCLPRGLAHSKACEIATAKVLSDSSYPSQNIDALDYPSCSTNPTTFAQRLWFLNSAGVLTNAERMALALEPTAYDPCVDNYAIAYLNRDDVRSAIHASPSVKHWGECSYKIDYNATDGWVRMSPLYLEIVGHGLKLEVYSGDDDSNCPTLGTMEWIYGLGLEEVSAWSPWYYNDTVYGNDQFAGFQVAWEEDLTFSTVHGAGHEVPTYKGEAALELFKRFLAR